LTCIAHEISWSTHLPHAVQLLFVLGQYHLLLFHYAATKHVPFTQISPKSPTYSIVQCINFNIPEDDDAHMAFFAMATPIDENSDIDWTPKARKIEDYFVGAMDKLTAVRADDDRTMPTKFPDSTPQEISDLVDEFLADVGGNKDTDCRVSITNPETFDRLTKNLRYYELLVINHVRESARRHPGTDESSPLAGYTLCFQNDHEQEEIFVMMETVVVSEEKEDHSKAKTNKKVFKKEHLTPLAEELSESLEAAQTVLHEMKYMEKREARMRITSDSVNSRVQYLSYNSIAVLLGVTYIQVTYLKRYFRKKKLL